MVGVDVATNFPITIYSNNNNTFEYSPQNKKLEKTWKAPVSLEYQSKEQMMMITR
ncbi:7524_t:CDS:2 [Entrophospora sp. SA101]|nr:7524_t:CDS:2 [Entrophospora sp. SA101]